MHPSVEHLSILWASIDELCSSLSDADWGRPTGCPGWTVKDNLSHLVDYEARALGRPGAEHTPADLSHTRNPLGEANEVGVDHRRSHPGPEVLAEFREVTAARLERLSRLTDADLEQPADTPAGPGTVASMLTLRVMDTWSHEQDIRRAVGRPGHAAGPAVDEAVDYWSRYLGLVVGKRAGAPDGTTAVFRIGDRAPAAVAVAGGRGGPADVPADPTVVLEMPAPTFAALVGGRTDAPDDVTVTGDLELGRRIVAGLGLMP